MYIQARMKSSFALVLYEICEKFKNIGYTGWLEISDVRKLMGVKDNQQYQKYLVIFLMIIFWRK